MSSNTWRRPRFFPVMTLAVSAALVVGACGSGGSVADAVPLVLDTNPDASGWASAVLLGVLGSVVGGGMAYMLGWGTDPWQGAGWLTSIAGSVLLLTVNAYAAKPRTTKDRRSVWSWTTPRDRRC